MKRRAVLFPAGAIVLGALLGGGLMWKQQLRSPEGERPAARVAVAPAGREGLPTAPVFRPMAAPATEPDRPAPRLPAPALKRTPARRSPPEQPSAGLDESGMVKTTRLPVEMLEGYLRENRRSAASLLAAARISGDPALLEEARRSFPGDPQVLLDWLLRAEASDNAKAAALQAFREAAPDNALGEYLFALEQFRTGNVDGAVAALVLAWGKPVAENYVLLTGEALEAAYRAAGYSPADAAATAYYGMSLETVAPLCELADWILATGQAYAETGYPESAYLTALMGVRLGSQMQEQTGRLLIMEELTAMGIERQFLHTLEPSSELVAGGQTVGARLQELEMRTEAIKAVVPVALRLATLDDVAKVRFFEYAREHGETEALVCLKRELE